MGMLALLTLSAIFVSIIANINFFFLCVYESLDPLDEQMSFYIKYLLLFVSLHQLMYETPCQRLKGRNEKLVGWALKSMQVSVRSQQDSWINVAD